MREAVKQSFHLLSEKLIVIMTRHLANETHLSLMVITQALYFDLGPEGAF